MIGGILDILGAASKTAEALAERAERGQLIDAGEARGLANGLEAVHAKLEDMRHARDRFDSDADFKRWVLGQITTDDDG